MEYRMNYLAFGGMFAVPQSVADEHLRLAGGLSLKVLLWMLRRGGESLDVDALAAALGQPRGEIIDALHFWIDRGLVLAEAEEGLPAAGRPAQAPVSQPPAPSALPEPPVAAPAPLPVIEIAKPTSEQIVARVSESPELRWLFQEAQRKLGRTIGFDGQSMLLSLHDEYGLPVEVITMLLEYCVTAGKLSNQYIAAVGRDWGQREIDSIEKAAEQVAALQESQSLWSELRQLAGLQTPKPTSKQTEYLRRWRRELGYGAEMIFLAYEETADHTGKVSFSYMNKVLGSWFQAGLKTQAEVEAYRQARAAKPPEAAPKKSPRGRQTGSPALTAEPSYDLEKFQRQTEEESPFALYQKLRGEAASV
ncbi:MAG: DnaD domain protein [Oscillospiraceae bacterium]|jgi:DnaD/phage-associated family protein|nr:DnaD domain protein [Oscillospiraceae bacterium]